MYTENETNKYTFSDNPFSRVFGRSRLSENDKKADTDIVDYRMAASGNFIFY